MLELLVAIVSGGGGGGRDCAGDSDTAADGGKSDKKECIKARYVVNAAGLFSDRVAAMIGDTSFNVKPRLGEYVLCKRPEILSKEPPPICRHIIFPCPGPMGKGIVVQPTLWGNLCMGPTAVDTPRRSATYDASSRGESAKSIISHLLSESRKLIPSFDAGDIIHSFAGLRAKTDRGDWIVESAADAGHPRFIHAAGIDSPGLAGSPAVALEVVRLLKEAGCPMPANPYFNPKRRPYIVPKDNYKVFKSDQGGKVSIRKSEQITPEVLKRDPRAGDPDRRVVCRCELVTEAEVVDAVNRGKHSCLKVESTQAVRKRTRAGMGWCQGQYCQSRVQAIISRELKKPHKEVPTRQWPESSILSNRYEYVDSKPGLK